MRVAVIIAILLGSAVCLEAQATGWPNTRQGFWIGVGMGDGSARIDCTYFCNSERRNGVSGYIRLGTTLSPHFLVGGETNGWVSSDGLVTEAIWVASAVVLWYPSRTGASYLKLGLGGMRYGTSTGVGDISTVSANAPSATLGAGYEVRVRSRVSLVPWIDVLASSRVGLDYRLGFIQPPPSPPDVRINLVRAGVGVSWQR